MNLDDNPPLEVMAQAELSTQFGQFTVRGYKRRNQQAVALIRGNITEKDDVLVRIQSSCLFAEAFHAKDCDCDWQLITSLGRIAQEGLGTVIYLFQEGRGFGIFDKIRAYDIQKKQRCDSTEAFRRLGYENGDRRTYDLAAEIILFEKVRSVRLMTSNAQKVAALSNRGIRVTQEPIHVEGVGSNL